MIFLVKISSNDATVLDIGSHATDCEKKEGVILRKYEIKFERGNSNASLFKVSK